MRFKHLCILATLCFLTACGQEETSEPAGVVADSDVATGGKLVINIDMDPALQKIIRVTSAVGARPGATNPVETTIMIKNDSTEKQTLQMKGEWYDARGNRYGGVSSTLTIAANQTHTLNSGTRSTAVTGYKLLLTQEIQSSDEQFAAAVSDPAIKVAEGYGMTYSETALDEVIPALPLRGLANGELFTGKTIAFYQGLEGKWRLEVSDHTYDVLRGVAFGRIERKDMQTIYLDFDKEPAAGDVLAQEMAYGGGIFQIKLSDGSMNTTSWNTSLAYAIYIDSWNRGARGEQPCSKRDIGSTSGKLFISFQGSEFTFKNSWVSGEFIDTPIVYCSLD